MEDASKFLREMILKLKMQNNLKSQYADIVYWLFSFCGRSKKMLNDKELKLVIMELETESISPEVYRYRT